MFFFISFNEIYFAVVVVLDCMLVRVIILLDDAGKAVNCMIRVFVSVIRKYVCRNNLEVHPVYAKCNKLTFLRFVTLETSLEQHRVAYKLQDRLVSGQTSAPRFSANLFMSKLNSTYCKLPRAINKTPNNSLYIQQSKNEMPDLQYDKLRNN